jgi:hypothetical protein
MVHTGGAGMVNSQGCCELTASCAWWLCVFATGVTVLAGC